ncbi:MAG: hypothetical protein ACE5R6_04470 [Candidatus Heimdallarchaeota archaeon]
MWSPRAHRARPEVGVPAHRCGVSGSQGGGGSDGAAGGGEGPEKAAPVPDPSRSECP